MSACPTCGKPVDALRARNVAVRDGKITAYCSPECLASAEPSKPHVAPPRATPAQGVVKSGVAPDSGPVIEIRYEPASGVVTSAPDPRQTPRTLEAIADPKAEAKKVEPAKKAEPPKQVEPAKEPAKKPEPPKSEPKPDPKKGDNKPKRLVVIDEVTATDIPPGAEPEKLSPAKISDEAAQAPAGTGTSIVGPRRAGRETMKRDNANVEQAEDWIDDEPADEGAVRAGTDVSELERPGRGGRGVLITLIVVLVVAGGVVIAYKLLATGSGAKAQPGSGSVGHVGTGSAPGAGSSGSGSAKRVVGPPTDLEKPEKQPPLGRAIAILRRYLEDKDSPRIQRVAAAALSRTGDKVAIERLATALSKDKLELAGQLDVAYALARAGDPRGRAALVAAITAPRRDDKLAAGRLLLQLGDKAGIDTLAAYLEVPQHRLGAAEQLARLSEPRGMKVLEAIRADKAASADDQARAVIGLGLAGKPEVTEELRALLTDNHFNVYAAEALAVRHDETARPVLAKQLELSALRVGAARALRLLAPQRDPAHYLETLTAALDDPRQQRDTEQIQLAEAILLLAGPARWSEAQLTPQLPAHVAERGQHALRRDLRLFYLFRLLATSYLFIPIFMLFQAERGLSFFERLALGGIYSAVVVAVEVPTGVFADRFGRRRSMMLGAVAMVGSCLLAIQAHDFATFAIAEALGALSMALCSGADSAYLYDLLAAHGREHEYSRRESAASAWHLIGCALAFAGGGLLATQDLALPYVVTAGVAATAAVVACLMHEDRPKARPWQSEFGRQTLGALAVVARNGRLAWIVGYSAVVFVLLRATVYVYQPFLEERGLATSEIGVVFAGVYVIAAGVAYRTHQLRTRFGDDRMLWALLGVLAIGFVGLAGAGSGPWMLALLVVQAVANGIYSPLTKPLLNREIADSSRRAAVLSVESMVRRAMMGVFAPLVGLYGQSDVMLLCGIVGLGGMLVLGLARMRTVAPVDPLVARATSAAPPLPPTTSPPRSPRSSIPGP